MCICFAPWRRRRRTIDCCTSHNELIAPQLSSKSAVHVSIENLHENFQLTNEEKRKLENEIPEEIVKKHVELFHSKTGSWHHLNANLINDERRITLCNQCAKALCDSECSIARGHDYGRLGDLPELNNVSRNAISPVRIFGQTLSVNGSKCLGHSISFKSDGPLVISEKTLPSLEDHLLPQITFLGSNEQWRKDKGIYKNSYSISAKDLFSWLDVLSNVNSLFKKMSVKIDKSERVKELLKSCENKIEEAMIFESNKKIEKLDDAVVGDRFGNDMDSDAYCDDAGHGGNEGKTFHVQESGIVNVIDHETLVQENFARSVLDTCPEPTKKDKLESNKEA